MFFAYKQLVYTQFSQKLYWNMKLGTLLKSWEQGQDVNLDFKSHAELSWYPQSFWSFKLRQNLESRQLGVYKAGLVKDTFVNL